MKVKNAPLEHENVAVLLEHIPIGATRSIHSLPVKRVEADHYSIDNGPVVDLVDAMSQIGSYSGQHHNPAKGLTVVGVGGESVEVVAFEIVGPFARTQTLDTGEIAATVKDDATDVTHLPTGCLLYRGDYKTQVKAGMKALRQWFSGLSSHDQKLLTEGYTPGEGLAIPQEQLDLLRQARSVVSGQRQNPDPAYIQTNPDAFEENEVVQVHSKDFPGWTFRGVVSAVQDDGRYFVSTKHGEDLGAYDADELTHTMLPAQSHREAYATFPQETLRKHEAKIAAAQRRELARGRGRAGKAVRLVSFENPDPAYIQANPFVPAVRGEPKKGKKNPEEILNLKAKNPSRAHYYQVKNKRGQVVAYTTTKGEAESVCPAGGKVERL